MKRRAEALINRRNFADTRSYMEYCLEVRQNSDLTVEMVRCGMDNLLEWATDCPLTKAADLRPTLPAYLNDRPIGPAYRQKLLANIRAFFFWARDTWADRYGKLGRSWVESLQSKKGETEVKEMNIFGLEQVRAITALTPETLAEERDIAAVAMLFLSGMRDGAFCTLPLRAVDWSKNPVLVRQWPSLGVKTKNRKAANTFLLPHPELEDLRVLCRAWQAKAEAAVGPKGQWFTVICPQGEIFDADQTPGRFRSQVFRRRMKALCERAGIPYLAPHRIRHGHVVYAMASCRSLGELKVVSQNVMHDDIRTTDAVYADLSTDLLGEKLLSLGQNEIKPGAMDLEAMLAESMQGDPELSTVLRHLMAVLTKCLAQRA